MFALGVEIFWGERFCDYISIVSQLTPKRMLYEHVTKISAAPEMHKVFGLPMTTMLLGPSIITVSALRMQLVNDRIQQ
jgi:hypothetical protein